MIDKSRENIRNEKFKTFVKSTQNKQIQKSNDKLSLKLIYIHKIPRFFFTGAFTNNTQI